MSLLQLRVTPLARQPPPPRPPPAVAPASTTAKSAQAQAGDTHRSHVAGAVSPRAASSDQLIGFYRHRASQSLTDRLAAGRRTGGNAFEESTTIDPSTSAAAAAVVPCLVFLVSPGHRWSLHPDDLLALLQQLWRGHTEAWDVLIYSSVGRAIQHVTNMLNGAPPVTAGMVHPGTLTASQLSIPLAIICTSAPSQTRVQFHQPHGRADLPIIYFGTRIEDLADVAANPERLHAVSRLDQLMALVSSLRTKATRSGALSLGGLLGTGVKRDHHIVDRFGRRTLPLQWTDEDVEFDLDRPISPESSKRKLQHAWQRHQLEEQQEAKQMEDDMEEEVREEHKANAIAPPPTLLADASVGRNHQPTSAQHPPASRLFSPRSKQQQPNLLVDIPERSASLGEAEPLPLHMRSPRPQVQFSSSTKHGPSATLPTSTPLDAKPARPITMRNPFGTIDGLPPPPPPASTATPRLRSAPGLSAGSITLSQSTPVDEARLAAIAALSARLHGLALPSGDSHRAPGSSGGDGGLPPSTLQERDALFARQLTARSELGVPDATRDLLMAERVRTRTEVRDLRGEERVREGRARQREARRRGWLEEELANQEANSFYASDTAASREDVDRLTSAASRVAEYEQSRAFRVHQLEESRAALEAEARQAIVERIRRYHEAQSTARAVALAKVPEAPKLTHLQAVFLSPRSRKQTASSASAATGTPAKDGATKRLAGSTGAAAPSAALLSPRAFLLPSHRPSALEIETALRRDFSQLAAETRAKEQTRLRLETAEWAKMHRAKVAHAVEQRREADLRAQREKREEDERRMREEVKRLVKTALTFEDDEDDDDEEEKDDAQQKDVRATRTASATSSADHVHVVGHRARVRSKSPASSLRYSPHDPTYGGDDDDDGYSDSAPSRRTTERARSTTGAVASSSPAASPRSPVGSSPLPSRARLALLDALSPDLRYRSFRVAAQTLADHSRKTNEAAATAATTTPTTAATTAATTIAPEARPFLTQVQALQAANDADDARRHARDLEERRSAWLKAHPPLVEDVFSHRGDKLPRRSAHAWLDQHHTVYGRATREEEEEQREDGH